jgi:hypothetical protein
MKVGLTLLGILVLLVGCQTFERTVTLPTREVQYREAPASIRTERPAAPERCAATEVVKAIKSACQDKNEFWIEDDSGVLHFTCAQTMVE